VRTTPSFAAHWLAPRIAGFQASCPGVELRLSSAVWLSVLFDRWLDTEESFFLARVAGRQPRPEAEVFWNWMIAQKPAED
jgi:hypothetical protein